MTTPPYAPPAKTTAVDTAALKRLEPFLTETLEEFGVAIRYAQKTVETPASSPSPFGYEAKPVNGVLQKVSVTDRQQFHDCTAQLLALQRGVVRDVFQGIVEMRRRYESTEDDNKTELDKRPITSQTPSRDPRDDTTLPRSPLDDSVTVPRFDDLSDVLTDPSSSVVALDLPDLIDVSPISLRGQALEALGPSIQHVEQRVTAWPVAARTRPGPPQPASNALPWGRTLSAIG